MGCKFFVFGPRVKITVNFGCVANGSLTWLPHGCTEVADMP